MSDDQPAKPKEDLSYWEKRWGDNNSPWHSDKPNKYLEQFYDNLRGDQSIDP